MKHLFFLSIVLALGIQDKSSLHGKWVSINKVVSYDFKKDGSIIYEQNGYLTLVNSFTLEKGVPMKASFKLRNGSNEVIIPALMQRVHQDTLIIEQFTPGKKPEQFTDGQFKHVLIRTVVKD